LNAEGKTTYYEEFNLTAEKKYKDGIAYGDSGQVLNKFTIISQDDHGNWTALDWYDPQGNLARKEESKYDKDKLVEQVWKSKEGVMWSNRTFKHNEKGDEVLIILTSYKSSPDSNVVKITRYRYDEYDQYGNWLKRSKLDEKGNVLSVTKRNIIYRQGR
jgi:hypothetical protein